MDVPRRTISWQAAIRRSVEAALVDRRHRPGPIFDEPLGDVGLFGPGSRTWQIHGDLPSMLVGGVAALLLQTLDPLAMAAVADHSAYREDPIGRLRRTAAFVATTTFAATPAAEAAIARVRRVHDAVRGVAPDGRPYHAADPELLTWVHAAEAAMILRSYRRYGPEPIGPAAQDDYLAESTAVARRIGAGPVPTTFEALLGYFESRRPQLAAGAQALTAVDFIVTGGPSRRRGPEDLVRGLIIQAALDVLPGWSCRLLGIREPLLAERLVVRRSSAAAFRLIRRALGPSPARTAAERRCAAPAERILQLV